MPRAFPSSSPPRRMVYDCHPPCPALGALDGLENSSSRFGFPAPSAAVQPQLRRGGANVLRSDSVWREEFVLRPPPGPSTHLLGPSDLCHFLCRGFWTWDILPRARETLQKPSIDRSRSLRNNYLKAKLLCSFCQYSDLLLAISGLIVCGAFIHVLLSVFDQPVKQAG